MTPDQVPAELAAMLDEAAGKEHSAQGPVMGALAAILTKYAELLLHEATVTPGAWLQGDELLDAIAALSRIPSAEQPGDWAALATKVNMLIDWLGMGGSLPPRLATAQRVGPYARGIVQRLDIVWSGGEDPRSWWVCHDCRAPLAVAPTDEPREEEGFIIASLDISGTIKHRAPCTEVRNDAEVT